MDEETGPEVVLYVRQDCHLCGPARQVVAAVCSERGLRWSEVDVDAAALQARWGDYVPVVTVDGSAQGFWRIDAARLARALDSARP